MLLDFDLVLRKDFVSAIGLVVHDFAPFKSTKYKEPVRRRDLNYIYSTFFADIYIHRAASPRPAFIVDLGVGIIAGEHIPGASTGIRTRNSPVMSQIRYL